MKAGRKTVGVSCVHRVMEGGKTFCNHDLPPQDVRFEEPLPPFLGVCRRCQRLYARSCEAQNRPGHPP